MSESGKKNVRYVVITSVSIMLCIAAGLPSTAQNSVSSDSELQLLLTARREALQTRVDIVERLVARTTNTPEELFAARNDLFDAEIEVATTRIERIEALERKLDNARQIESLMQQRKEAARGTEAEVLKAKADRIGVEIDLVRERKN